MAESENEKPKECETTNWCSNGFIYFQEVEANKQALSCYDQEETHSPIEVYQGILRLLSVLVEYETRIFDTPFKMEGLSYFDRLDNTLTNLRYKACQQNDGSGYDQNISWFFLSHRYTPFEFTIEMKQRTWEDIANIIISRCHPNETEDLCKKLGKFMSPANDTFEGMYFGTKVYTNGQWGVDIPLIIHNTDQKVLNSEGEWFEDTLPFSERFDNTSNSTPLIYRYDVRRLHPSYGIHRMGTIVYSDPYYGCGQHRYLPFAMLQPTEPDRINTNPNLSRITWNQNQLQDESFKQLLIRELQYTKGWSLTVNTSIPKLIYTTFDDKKNLDKPKRRWSI